MTIILSGLALGAIYALVAVGYNIVFISSKTFNFAQAQLIMVGAFMAYTAFEIWPGPQITAAAGGEESVPLLLLEGLIAIVIAGVVVTAVTAVQYYTAIRPVKNHDNFLVTTLGFSIVLDGVTQLIWGGEPKQVRFALGDDAIDILGGRATPAELTLVVVALVTVLAAILYLGRSINGLGLRAISEDQEAAQLRGVRVRRLALIAFLVSGAIAGVLGVFVGPKTYAVATLGASLALKGFVVLAVGGFGSMGGVLVGGLVVGLTEVMAARYLGGAFSNIGIFAILVLVLLIRPAGLFVRSRERAV